MTRAIRSARDGKGMAVQMDDGSIEMWVGETLERVIWPVPFVGPQPEYWKIRDRLGWARTVRAANDAQQSGTRKPRK